jgi:hypothetical protein
MPMFMKSNKYENRGTKLVDKVKHSHLMHILDMLAHKINIL